MRTLEAQARGLKGQGVRGEGPGRAVPRLWLVTDALRLPDPLPAAANLPPGSAVLARDLAPAVLRAVARLARRRRLVLLVAGDGRLALALGAGLHLPERRPTSGLLAFLAARRRYSLLRGALLSVAAHGVAGLARARRLRADAVVLSPAFATASHPGAPGLGPLRWGALAVRASRRLAVVALGGIAAGTVARLPRRRLAGLAAVAGLGRADAAPRIRS
jgi:thiamine-phosphate pyrophosphorylase